MNFGLTACSHEAHDDDDDDDTHTPHTHCRYMRRVALDNNKEQIAKHIPILGNLLLLPLLLLLLLTCC